MEKKFNNKNSKKINFRGALNWENKLKKSQK